MTQLLNQVPACPACNRNETRRTGRRGLLDRMRSLFHLYPWECTACGQVFRFKSRGKSKRRASNSGKQYTPGT